MPMLTSSKKLSDKATVLIVTLLFIILNTEAAPTYLYHFCSNATTYTPNSTYQTNLILLLSSLSSNSTRSATVFHTSTAGQTPPNVVYSLLLCRGDVTAAVCRDCVGNATGEILTRCPNQKSAVVWYDECMLRYDNDSFFSTVDEGPMVFLISTANVTEQTRFQQLVEETMDKLANRASNYNPNDEFVKRFQTMDELTNRASIDNPNDEFVKGFATQEANFTSYDESVKGFATQEANFTSYDEFGKGFANQEAKFTSLWISTVYTGSI